MINYVFVNPKLQNKVKALKYTSYLFLMQLDDVYM